MNMVPIKDYPDYFITDTGDVYSYKSGNIIRLKQHEHNGYLNVCLYNKQGKSKWCRVHRLVANAFIPNLNNKPQVNHKNGVRNDNRVENLNWCTNAENQKHSYDFLGHKKTQYWLGKKGREFPSSKVVLQIKDNKIIAEFYGAAEAYRKTSINHRHISECCGGKRKSAGGYQWKYKQSKEKD